MRIHSTRVGALIFAVLSVAVVAKPQSKSSAVKTPQAQAGAAMPAPTQG
jgi:hypothetical protein